MVRNSCVTFIFIFKKKLLALYGLDFTNFRIRSTGIKKISHNPHGTKQGNAVPQKNVQLTLILHTSYIGNNFCM